MQVFVVTEHEEYAEDGSRVDSVYTSREQMERELRERGYHPTSPEVYPEFEAWEHHTLVLWLDVTEMTLKEGH